MTSKVNAVFYDIKEMVALSYQKRRFYEKAQAQFWRHAEGAEDIQFNWFKELINHVGYMALIAKNKNKLLGFIIGQITDAPAVYDPGGKTLLVDDFCVTCPSLWHLVGGNLLQRLRQDSKSKNVVQVLIVCGSHDQDKQRFLRDVNLNVASEWYVGNI